MGLSITTGAFPVVLLVVGLLTLAASFYGRSAAWWRRRVPVAVAAALVLTAAITLFTNNIWHPFADPVPTDAVLWIGLTLISLALALARPSRWWVRISFVGLALVVAVAGAAQVNAGFGAYPTLGALMGEPLPGQVNLSDVLGGATRTPVTVTPGSAPASSISGTSVSGTSVSGTSSSSGGSSSPGSTGTAAPTPTSEPPPTTGGAPAVLPATDGPLVNAWQPTAAVPGAGQVTTAPIPGTVSGFAAADAWIYLPPAFLMSPRPQLPVLILLTGQPGSPRMWFDGGNVQSTMDAYAAAHNGLAPVVVVPDWIGTQSANPLCVDSAAGGNDFTYLTVDVPSWIKANLGVDQRASRWSVGGLSAGATCAVQLGVNAPQVYPTFLCFSGQEEPTLSTRPDTVNALFGGNEDAFKKINPIDVLQSRPFPELAGMFVAGDGDPDYGPQTKTVYTVAKQAGVDATFMELPGGHDFPLWSAALVASMDWLGRHLSITG